MANPRPSLLTSMGVDSILGGPVTDTEASPVLTPTPTVTITPTAAEEEARVAVTPAPNAVATPPIRGAALRQQTVQRAVSPVRSSRRITPLKQAPPNETGSPRTVYLRDTEVEFAEDTAHWLRKELRKSKLLRSKIGISLILRIGLMYAQRALNDDPSDFIAAADQLLPPIPSDSDV